MKIETKCKYNRHIHGDFAIYYDTNLKRYYWLLGYFGGGSINIQKAYNLALDYSKTYNVEFDSIYIDEILSSRRYKGF